MLEDIGLVMALLEIIAVLEETGVVLAVVSFISLLEDIGGVVYVFVDKGVVVVGFEDIVVLEDITLLEDLGEVVSVFEIIFEVFQRCNFYFCA